MTASNFFLRRTTRVIMRQSVDVTRNSTYKNMTTKSLFTSCATSGSKTTTQANTHYQQLPRPQQVKQQVQQQQVQQQQVRYMGRKAGKMGKHLETLNELAHREEHEKAKQKRQKNKKGGKRNNSEIQTRMSNDEIPSIEEDETETIFDHGGNDNDDDDVPSLPAIEEVKGRMMKVVNAMQESFKAIRGAEATPELFDTVQVKAYGAMTPLNSVAQVVISTPTRATITCFDPELSPHVRDAVRDMAGMNFNPSIEEGVVVVPIPRVSAETRKALVKQLGKTAENTRQRIRRIRRAAQDVVKKAKDGKMEGISDDDAFRTGKEIDAVTEECIKRLNDVVDEKQASVMNI